MKFHNIYDRTTEMLASVGEAEYTSFIFMAKEVLCAFLKKFKKAITLSDNGICFVKEKTYMF